MVVAVMEVSEIPNSTVVQIDVADDFGAGALLTRRAAKPLAIAGIQVTR
jgi:hypothetical protein